MDSSSAFTPSVLERWRRRENLLPGLALIALAAAGWAYVAHPAASMGSMQSAVGGMAMGGIRGAAVFLFGWAAMMVAMMVPATLPLILLYRTIARTRLGLARARIGTAVLLVGYVAVWAMVGLPVYAYNSLSSVAGSLAAVLPALLLIVGGAYQFTPLKRICHARCSSPLFYVTFVIPTEASTLRLDDPQPEDCEVTWRTNGCSIPWPRGPRWARALRGQEQVVLIEP